MIKSSVEKYLARTNNKSFNPKAIFFDMDGVLFDSLWIHVKSWSEAFGSVGIDFPAEEAYLNEGSTGEQTVNRIYKEQLNRPASKEEQKSVYAKKSEVVRSLKKPEPIPFMYEFMEEVNKAGLDIWVVTGSGQKTFFENLNTHYNTFVDREKVITGLDVTNGKPNPEPYLLALERCGVKENEAIVIENAPLGVKASVGANIFTIAINTGILKDEILWESGSDVVLSGSEELLSRWSEILNCRM